MAKGLNLEQNRMFWNKTEDGKKHSEVNSNWKQHFTTARTKGTASVRGILCLHLSFLYTASISELQPASVPGWEKDICRVPRLLQRNVFFFLGKVHNWAEASESKATQNGSVLFNWYCLSSKCFLQFCGNVHLPHLSALSSCFGGFFFFVPESRGVPVPAFAVMRGIWLPWIMAKWSHFIMLVQCKVKIVRSCSKPALKRFSSHFI